MGSARYPDPNGDGLSSAWGDGYSDFRAGLVGGEPAAFSRVIASGGEVIPGWVSAEIDLTAAASTVFQLVSPQPLLFRAVTISAWLTSVGGTRSATANVSSGANAGIDDLASATNVAAGVLTQAAGTTFTFFTALVAPISMLDLTANGLRLKINTSLTGTVPLAKVRLLVSGFTVPL